MSEAKQISLLEQTVVDVINKSVSSIEKGAEFLAGQLPDIAQQYLQWKFAWAGISTTLWVVGFLIIFFPVRLWVKSKWEKEKAQVKEYNEINVKRSFAFGKEADPFPFWFPFGTFSFTYSLFGVPNIICNLYTMTQIYVAPKVYLIEWAKSFL